MAQYRGPIDNYSLRVETNTVRTRYYNSIILRGDFGLAFVYFVPNGTAFPPNMKYDDRDAFKVFYRADEWDAIVDMLRNEDTTSFDYRTYTDDRPDYCLIFTGAEPVGEEESLAA